MKKNKQKNKKTLQQTKYTKKERKTQTATNNIVRACYTCDSMLSSPIVVFQVSVTVLDQNDSPPVLKAASLHVKVSEDTPAGHSIATLSASDPDTVGEVRFSLLPPEERRFALDAASGELVLREALDREQQAEYQLRVQVADGHQHTEATLLIQVSLAMLPTRKKWFCYGNKIRDNK